MAILNPNINGISCWKPIAKTVERTTLHEIITYCIYDVIIWSLNISPEWKILVLICAYLQLLNIRHTLLFISKPYQLALSNSSYTKQHVRYYIINIYRAIRPNKMSWIENIKSDWINSFISFKYIAEKIFESI